MRNIELKMSSCVKKQNVNRKTITQNVSIMELDVSRLQ